MITLAFLIGYLSDNYGPQPYHYKNQVVIVNNKYQCPTYCMVKHNHHVYFGTDSHGMFIDKTQLGKKYKKKKSKEKNKR